MAHSTSQGLVQEQGALCILVESHLADLEKRLVDAKKVADYKAHTKAMQATVAASGGKTSDKEQLTVGEAAAKGQLLAEIRRIQGGVRRTFPNGSPQRKEFFVGESNNHSTSLLLKWADGIAAAWVKYKDDIIAKGNLLQSDLDTMVSVAATLGTVDSTQENAKHAEVPAATAAALKAIALVEADADFIYGAARAEYYDRPEILGQFEAIRPLRYAVERPPKVPPPDTTKK